MVSDKQNTARGTLDMATCKLAVSFLLQLSDYHKKFPTLHTAADWVRYSSLRAEIGLNFFKWITVKMPHWSLVQLDNIGLDSSWFGQSSAHKCHWQLGLGPSAWPDYSHSSGPPTCRPTPPSSHVERSQSECGTVGAALWGSDLKMFLRIWKHC